MVRHFFVLTLCMMACNAPVYAQEGQAADEVKQKEPNLAWIISCSSSGQSTDLTCQVSQRISSAKSRQPIMTVSVQALKSNNENAMLINLAHGFYLVDGVKVQVDGGETTTLPFQTSDSTGLAAAMPLSSSLLASMKAGNVMNVTVTQYSPRNNLTFPISLKGFTAAFRKLSGLK
ncbi:invasion associated locus B family protein [Roseibium album]|uniref:invasion associated locus B family protein n=1 Tax=Roseibium album TaxID=311410 RepID=UPI003BAF73DD